MFADVVERISAVERGTGDLELVAVEQQTVGLEYTVDIHFYFRRDVCPGIVVVDFLDIAPADRRKSVSVVFAEHLAETCI